LAQDAVRGIKYESLYVEKIENGKKWYSGSSSVTSAMIAEALFYFERYDNDESLQSKYRTCSLMQEKHILSEIRRELALSPLFLNLSETEKSSLISFAINDESIENIVMLPYKCLGNIHTDDISSDVSISLGLAQIFGTIAYGIYDKINDGDGEIGQSDLLCRANIAHTECLKILTKYATSCEVLGVLDLFTNMNIAMEWEANNTQIKYSNDFIVIDKIPDYCSNKLLENKSIGMAVVPIISTVLHSGMDRNKKTIEPIKSFFENYLSARQIQDDTHDWLIDIKRGRLNYASSLCLEVIKNDREMDTIEIGTIKKYTLDEIISTLSLFMKYKGIDMLADKIIRHLDEADLAIEKLTSLYGVEYTYLKSIIDKLRSGARNAVHQKNLLSDFTKYYYTESAHEITAM
jgi:hypothetical protein